MHPSAGAPPVAGICHARGHNAGLPPVWLIYITVDDLDQAVRRCEELHGKVLRPATGAGPSGRFCVIEDPAGAVCALFEAAVTT
jgi:predicted enzyme related to lactoylglutathione lyase